jgi:hypothetical protein
MLQHIGVLTRFLSFSPSTHPSIRVLAGLVHHKLGIRVLISLCHVSVILNSRPMLITSYNRVRPIIVQNPVPRGIGTDDTIAMHKHVCLCYNIKETDSSVCLFILPVRDVLISITIPPYPYVI